MWNITEGDENCRIDAAIGKTREFFEHMGVKTHLSAYGLDVAHIDPLLAQLEAHRRVAVGEHRDVTVALSREVLEASLHVSNQGCLRKFYAERKCGTPVQL